MTRTCTQRALPPFVAATSTPERIKVARAVLLAVCVLGLSLVAMAHEPIFITFDPPGSTFTVPHLITENGVIGGYYYDDNGVAHGFLRAPDGQITTFSVPGAGNGGSYQEGTFAWSHNERGEVAGYYIDNGMVAHGFLRLPDGDSREFNVDGAGINSGQGTFATNINPEGEIAGYYIDSNNVYHGFSRGRNGAIIPFDTPGAGAGPGQGTFTEFVDCLNPAGAIAGDYTDSNDVEHGFLRTPGGHIATFNAPGAGTTAGSYQGTYSAGINPPGSITGFSVDNANVFHGFLRARDGKIVMFDAPGAGAAIGQGTQPTGINSVGAITGLSVSSDFHGFVRSPDGNITTFDVPGAGCAGNGTYPTGINSEGAITGLYTDANCVWHGFLRTKQDQ